MVIEFSVGNYRSFNDIQTLSFRATGLVSEDKTVDENNIANADGARLLKTIGVYGPNGSGKSNLIKGFNFFKRMVSTSLENEDFLSENINPNKQVVHSSDDSGYFQIVLLLKGKKYRYGFTLKNKQLSAGGADVATEWLFGPAGKNETWYFKRKGNKIEVNGENFAEGLNIPFDTKLRANTLFLSFCSSYNGEVSGEIKRFISNKIRIDNTGNNRIKNNILTNSLIEEGSKELVLNWLKSADLSFNDIKIAKGNENISISLMDRVKLSKDIYGENGKVVNTIEMDLSRDESEGTQKYYSFIGKFYNKFQKGGLFISDEIDSNFHPALLRKIVGMFNNPTINKANAQLLFTSHDTNLMSPDIMRRDQFYFTEKSPTDSTILYSLADLKGIRNNADFAKQYLAGYYGALPMLGNYLNEQSNPE